MANKSKRKNKKTRRKKEELLINSLKNVIGGFLKEMVEKPAFKTVDNDFEAQNNIANILTLCMDLEELILEKGEELYLDDLKNYPKDEIECISNTLKTFLDDPCEGTYSNKAETVIRKHLNKKHLLSYLTREIKWISVSILSASYISALILIRSLFELLIGLATNITGSMTQRIESISYISEDESISFKKTWNRLNAWAHPYGKWEKNVCPIYYSHAPLYHPTHCGECISQLTSILDLYLIIASDQFKISPLEIKNKTHDTVLENCQETYPFFYKRLISNIE